MENSKKSIGEKRVRVNFNPMGTDKIMFKKKEFAQLIDGLESEKKENTAREESAAAAPRSMNPAFRPAVARPSASRPFAARAEVFGVFCSYLFKKKRVRRLEGV